MKVADIMTKNPEELQKMLQEYKQKLAQAAIDLRTKDVKDVKQIHELKKDIARLQTVIRQQQLAAQGESA